jgi:hypothetical protein
MRKVRDFKKWTAWAVLALGAIAWGQQRPLPEVAREKSGKTATRVLTNEDLEAARPAEPAPAAPLTTSDSPAPAERPSGPRITVPGLLIGGTLAEAQATLQSLQHDEEVLLRRYAQIEQKLATERDEHLRKLYSNSLERRDETLARKHRQMEQVKQAIESAKSSRTSSPGSKHEGATSVEK